MLQISVLTKKTTLHLLYQVGDNLFLSQGSQKLFTDRPYITLYKMSVVGVVIPEFAVTSFSC